MQSQHVASRGAYTVPWVVPWVWVWCPQAVFNVLAGPGCTEKTNEGGGRGEKEEPRSRRSRKSKRRTRMRRQEKSHEP